MKNKNYFQRFSGTTKTTLLGSLMKSVVDSERVLLLCRVGGESLLLNARALGADPYSTAAVSSLNK